MLFITKSLIYNVELILSQLVSLKLQLNYTICSKSLLHECASIQRRRAKVIFNNIQIIGCT